ncbi:MAG: hypothetical protein K0S53_748 [Bacteroidetes bacterium]|nr:hypothetical protein [Bacteroidota bacterium]MDF2451534.1 hypothetical protein [Bacteroidota bacterium]
MNNFIQAINIFRNMKPILILTAICSILLSCKKKDWNCTCNVNGNFYTKTIPHSRHNTASNKCNEYGKSIGQTYSYYSYNCEIK